jgi:hypothetical protein
MTIASFGVKDSIKPHKSGHTTGWSNFVKMHTLTNSPGAQLQPAQIQPVARHLPVRAVQPDFRSSHLLFVF